MPRLTDAAIRRLDNWIPLFLLVLPTVMVFIPLLVQIHPKAALFVTPLIPSVFQILLILYAAVLGGWSRLRQVSIRRPVLIIAAALLGIVIYTTFWVAEIKLYSALKLGDLLLYMGLSFFVGFIFDRGGPELIQRTLIAIFASIVLVIPLIAFLFHYKIPDYYWWPRFIPGFDYIRIYGFSLSARIAIGTGFLALPGFQKPMVKWVTFVCLCLLWTTLFWTSSRGGIVALIAVAPVMAVLIPAFRQTLVYAVFALFIGAAASSQISGDTGTIGFFNTFSEITDPRSLEGTGEGRMELWKAATDTIADRPLLGHGFAQTYVIVDLPRPKIHAHNIVVETLLAWGVIGTACAGFLVLWLWFKGFKRLRQADMVERIPAFYAINVLLLYAWVDGTYYYYQSLIPLAICTAVMVATPGRKRNAP